MQGTDTELHLKLSQVPPLCYNNMKNSIPVLPGLPELPSAREKQNKSKQPTNFFINKNHTCFHCRKTEQKSNATSEQEKFE